mmetsp:Transcript_1031/g.1285  ORF Transcript_1031/g.1285 Transcript_1031/m.1285 type:complete len:215 (+) Transcript_1031:106-750(+)|eukprot:CAMPEP_0197292352 /NCGR_PEP_ID=MMETSP0890-20130614/22667_1 /TAXON_ID=44058 ORGANISM="Aureoumbra lagunensis, Strain CCMP1510" /NCGR_SAMPLE_ID=MMETSP0890 /ASSEMBLY_ACC=CAM_ASM_000533 /LENGTH=214 /DNA_ID=CAMNT_0042766165 /DNA_START=86 /DNA_END=730 /DNA_ORIENTATION=+
MKLVAVALIGVSSALILGQNQNFRRVLQRRSSQTEEEVVEPVVLTEAQESARRTKLEFTPTKYFFGRVSIYLGPEFKPLSEVLDPSYKDDSTAVAAVVVESPFGMIIEESATVPGKIEVIEVSSDSNAEKAGILPGDILRGCTAMALNIQKASEEDAGFSVGLSEGKKSRAYLPTDRRNFDQVMAALQSNAVANGGPGEATLVFERRVNPPQSS